MIFLYKTNLIGKSKNKPYEKYTCKHYVFISLTAFLLYDLCKYNLVSKFKLCNYIIYIILKLLHFLN